MSSQSSARTGRGSTKTSLLSKDERKSLVECVGRRRVQQLSPAHLKLGTKPHEELIEATSLLMPTATDARGTSDGGSYSMCRALRWRESINLPPNLTVAAVELVDGLIPLLKSA